MPYLWAAENNGNWSETSLDSVDADRLIPAIGADGALQLAAHGDHDPTVGTAWTLTRTGRERGPSGEGWVIVFASAATAAANGLPTGGVRVLAHGDEIVYSTGQNSVRLIYSAERLARVGSYRPPQGGAKVYCGRCKEPIADGCDSVVCPQCGVAYHATTQFPCWTYGPRCNCCGQSTDLAAGLNWSPAML